MATASPPTSSRSRTTSCASRKARCTRRSIGWSSMAGSAPSGDDHQQPACPPLFVDPRRAKRLDEEQAQWERLMKASGKSCASPREQTWDGFVGCARRSRGGARLRRRTPVSHRRANGRVRPERHEPGRGPAHGPQALRQRGTDEGADAGRRTVPRDSRPRPRRPLRVPHAAPQSRLFPAGDPVPDARHRRQRRGLQLDRRHPAAAVSARRRIRSGCRRRRDESRRPGHHRHVVARLSRSRAKRHADRVVHRREDHGHDAERRRSRRAGPRQHGLGELLRRDRRASGARPRLRAGRRLRPQRASCDRDQLPDVAGPLSRRSVHRRQDAAVQRPAVHDRRRRAEGVLRHVRRLRVSVLGAGVDAGAVRRRRATSWRIAARAGSKALSGSSPA